MKLSNVIISRLSIYVRLLSELEERRKETVSSAELAELTGFGDAQIRKDLNLLGQLGISGTGYDVKHLQKVLSRVLGLDRQWKVALVGVGNLGSALLAYPGFKQQGFNIIAVFDNDLRKIGKNWEGIVVQDVGELVNAVRSAKIRIGIIAVPASEAQRVAASLLKAGVECILNFAPLRIKLPKEINLRNVDLTMELENFSCFLTNKSRRE
ncbi:MAG: redox-sensing transcriptional repressor Rex [Nitrospirae bacterium]|nr:redox-sensing transcriptional repressor Rex [Nitrospirota bacterium]